MRVRVPPLAPILKEGVSVLIIMSATCKNITSSSNDMNQTLSLLEKKIREYFPKNDLVLEEIHDPCNGTEFLLSICSKKFEEDIPVRDVLEDEIMDDMKLDSSLRRFKISIDLMPV